MLTTTPHWKFLHIRWAPSSMLSNLTRYSRYLAFFILILAILYQYEIPSDISTSDNSTFLLTKTAIFPRNRTFVYQIIADIQKFPLVGNQSDGLVWVRLDSISISLQWYPNVARVEHVKASARSSADLPAKEYYRLITKMPVIGSYSLSRWFWKDPSFIGLQVIFHRLWSFKQLIGQRNSPFPLILGCWRGIRSSSK